MWHYVALLNLICSQHSDSKCSLPFISLTGGGNNRRPTLPASLSGLEGDRCGTPVIINQLSAPANSYNTFPSAGSSVQPGLTSCSYSSSSCVFQQPKVHSNLSTSPVNNNNMCGTTGPCLVGSSDCSNSRRSNSPCPRSPATSPMKRKLTLIDYEEDYDPRPKRISPFHNTPKQRRDEKRKVLRMSIQKLRQIDDPEVFLRRSVLINNMTKRMQKELREEKRNGYGYGYYQSTFSSYNECPIEQDCFYSSSPAHRKRLSSCSYEQQESESSSYINSQMSPPTPCVTSSPSLSSSTCSNTSHNLDSLSHHQGHHQRKVPLIFDEPCVDSQPVEKLSDDLSESLLRTVCGLTSQDSDSPDCSTADDPTSTEQDMESCASLSDSSSEESSPPASPPSDLDVTSEFSDASNESDGSSNLTEMDKQILGEMDIVFNNLISVLSET